MSRITVDTPSPDTKLILENTYHKPDATAIIIEDHECYKVIAVKLSDLEKAVATLRREK